MAQPTGLPKKATKQVTVSVNATGSINVNQYFSTPNKPKHLEKAKIYKIDSNGAFNSL